MAKSITLKFEANQQFQLDAVSAVVDLFQNCGFSAQTPDRFALVGAGAIGGDEILPNLPHGEELYDADILPSLHEVQTRHGLELSLGLTRDGGQVLEGAGTELHEFPSFTVEMETGTGKTYCYFRTIYELRKQYGLSKFIIIVPSIAIFQGVLKTEEITRTHFRSLYGNEQVDVYGYDGARLNRVRIFATANTVQVMVMTVDSFNKLNNVFYKASEKLPGELLPYQYIQGARPIVILDEPQSLDNTEKARQAIRTLHPLFGLRYSATHRTHPNLVYRLSPVEAYRKNLVKRITVVGVSQTENVNAPLLTLEKVTQNPLIAHVRTRVLEKGETKEKVIPLKQKDNLFQKTKREEHAAGFTVTNISARAGDKFIEFESGIKLILEGQGTGQAQTAKPEVFRLQIEEAIKAHFEAQDKLKERGIKVLSLFFIDRVANYRGDDALLRRLFEEAFERLKSNSQYFARMNASEVHNGYFAQRRVKGAKDAAAVEEFDTNLEETRKSKEEKEAERAAFKLIMRDKERLLSFDEPVSFLFAHSALREGWDNPNVFQICTLNQSASTMRKRQEIGRGLRLCVNQEGARVTDEDVNVLTVVANESYKSFCETLQQEYREEGDEAPPLPTDKKSAAARRNDDLYHSQEFKEFWRKLNRRARYRIRLDQPVLIEECAAALQAADFQAPKLARTKGRFVITEFRIELKRVTSETATLRVVVKDTDGKTRDNELPLRRRDKLAVAMHDPRFRNFTIDEISGAGDDARVRFANGIEVTPFQAYEFDSELGQRAEEMEIIELDDRYPVFDFIGRAAEQTHLTRATLNQVFARFAERASVTIFRNPEGFTRLFIETIKRVVAQHVAERVEFEIAADEAFDAEDLFPKTKPFPQQEVVASGPRGLYDKTQVDSDVERFFIERRLRPDEAATLLFFKFPPKFKLDFPRIIGDYNPDWGVIRIQDGKAKLQLVRETKGTTKLDKLQYSQEKLKIRCAQRYFETLGIDYRVVDREVEKWWLPDVTADGRDGSSTYHLRQE